MEGSLSAETGGGQGIREAGATNLAHLSKFVWRLHNKPLELWSQVLKAKYFPGCDILQAKKRADASWTWQSVQSVISMVQANYCWQVRSGTRINFWHDFWIPSVVERKPNPRADVAVELGPQLDELKWGPSKDGYFSIKSSYRAIMSGSSLEVLEWPSQTLLKLWHNKANPRAQLFAWKCIRDMIPCRATIADRLALSDISCPLCGDPVESLHHILLECPFTRAVWFGRVNGFAVKTVDKTGAGDVFVGDFFLPYQRMKLTPNTDMGIEHLQHALEISPGNVAAYFGLASRLLGLSKECVNNGAFSWGASLLKETSDVANTSTVLTGKCFLHLEVACWKNKRLIRISAKAKSAIHAQSVTAQTSFNSLMPKISQLHESVKSKRLQLINFNKTTTTSTIIQSQMPHLDEWSALEVDYSTSLSGEITALQAASLRLPVNENVRVDIEELEGALNSASNVIETMSSHFQSFLPKALQTNTFPTGRRNCGSVRKQGVSGLGSRSDSSGIKKSMLVVSEFVGCSPSLSGAIRINLWNIETIGEALNEAISMAESEKQLLHEKYYMYVSTHDVAYWSRSFMQDLEGSCKDHFRRRCYAMGIGFGFRLVALDANFKRLEISTIESAYKKYRNRGILLDYDGTVMPQTTINKTPSDEDCKQTL
ncbi:hypothetical protein GIB67_027884 [Kingdonia uniflora]|uniref:Reverse transcriptase zinc-binding domain-containing protein n=1 Tax=Kingdonia uniflora TaxID=39325 RepID=A0A7J7LGC6_9MAGN|nr:hypothetical protein GIB67_027884 [Kingdonia uniflora]